MYTTGGTGTTLQVYDTNANEIKRVIINTWNNKNAVIRINFI